MDKIDVYLESAIAVLQTKSIGHMAALRAAGSIIALAEVEHAKWKSAQQSVHPTLLESPREQTRCDCASCQQELSELPQSG